MTWVPKLRNIVIKPQPDFVPTDIYNEAMSAIQFYNREWEFWVWSTSKDHNCSQAKAEDACIRGLRKALLRVSLIYGDKVGKWYEEFLDMGDIFDKVKHPSYKKQLGDD